MLRNQVRVNFGEAVFEASYDSGPDCMPDAGGDACVEYQIELRRPMLSGEVIHTLALGMLVGCSGLTSSAPPARSKRFDHKLRISTLHHKNKQTFINGKLSESLPGLFRGSRYLVYLEMASRTRL
jgi:hypothetical protein